MSKKIMTITSIILLILTSISVCYANSNNRTLEKQYIVDYKTADEFYNTIEKTVFEDKTKYNLDKIDRVDNFKTLTKEQELVETIETSINDKEKIINMFNESKDCEQEGYIGTLIRDDSTLKISVNNSYQEEYKVYLQKNYDNVPSNELNDIPKTIEEDETTYYLVNPVWDIAKTEKVEDNNVPVKYNGIMYYEGVKTRTIITSYIATIRYKGELSKQVPETSTFTVSYIKSKEDLKTMTLVAGGTGIIFVSGIILYRLKNVKVYNLQEGKYKLVRSLHLNKNKMLIDLTPTNFQTRVYKIVLSKSLYKSIKGKNIKFKYSDKNINYIVDKKDFEIYV